MKKIGLFDIDSRIPNLALMKLSSYYKQQCLETEFYSPLLHSEYWLIYASKIFNYPHPNDAYLRDDMILGGSGFYFSEKFKKNFHVLKKLPKKFDHMYPDYDLYECDYSVGYITKGCIRTCGFCIVPKLEGMIYKFADLDEFCHDQNNVKLLDNNILAYKNHIDELRNLRNSEKRIDFNQGLDIRLITSENAKLLSEIKRWKGLRLRFAFDNLQLKKLIEYKLKILNDMGITNGCIQFYVLIGYNTNHQENLKRILFLKEKRIDIFVMPYNKMDPYQKSFARWVNRRFYKYQTWEDYVQKVQKRRFQEVE